MDRCSLVGLWSVLPMDRCSLVGLWSMLPMDRCSLVDRWSVLPMDRCSLVDHWSVLPMDRCALSDQCYVLPMDRCALVDQCYVLQMDRPASLACLEGLVLEESSEDSGGSADSICFIFMGRKGPESAARLRAMGGSISSSEDTEHMIPLSRSTESIPFEREGRLEGFVPPLSERSASLGNIYTAAATGAQHKKQLHRSRSASLLDVATTTVSDDELDENIFPPRVYADSEASWEGASTTCVEDELSSHGTASDPNSARTNVSVGVSTITNPAFVHRASLVEPSAEQHLYMSSPPQLYTSGSAAHVGGHSRQLADDAGRLFQREGGAAPQQRTIAILEVESGQPYFKYRSPGNRPQQSESEAQTETEGGLSQAVHSVSTMQAGPGTDLHRPASISSLRRSQSTGSLVTLVSPSTSGAGSESNELTRRRLLSPSSERWMELSHLMLETTQILQNLQQTFPHVASPRSSAGSHASLSSPRPVSYTHLTLPTNAEV